MNKVLVFVLCVTLCGEAFGQTTAPAAPDAATAAITQLRQGLIDAFNRQDIDGVLSFLSPDVVVTWQDGTVCVGPDQVKNYYLEKMKGPAPIVSKITSDPQVDGRHVHDGWAISYGRMNDHFVLSNGMDFDMNSRFTATIAAHGTRWLVNGMQLSVDAFDNPILEETAMRSGEYSGITCGIGGLVIGFVAAIVFAKRKRAGAA